MKDYELKEEKVLLHAMQQRNIRAFMQFYKNYGEDLLIFTYTHLRNPRLAAKTADEFFESLWMDANFEAINPPIYTFLIDQMRKICKQKP